MNTESVIIQQESYSYFNSGTQETTNRKEEKKKEKKETELVSVNRTGKEENRAPMLHSRANIARFFQVSTRKTKRDK